MEVHPANQALAIFRPGLPSPLSVRWR